MPAPRTAGKRGRRPVKREGERFALKWVSEYATEPLPAPSYPVDATGGIAADGWLMLGNGPDATCTTHPNGVGDCGYCGRQHVRMAKAACYGETETWETSDELVAEYLAYDHGQDQGVVIADALLAWYQEGRILGFAPVDHTDPAAVDSAMQAFKGVLIGVNLTDDAEQLFSAGQPWTVANGERSDPDDGHCIAKVKADGQDTDEYVTWGALQAATRAWSAACVVEAWAFISNEDEASKIDLAALQADIDALGGTEGASVSAPVPVDHEGLLHELAGFIRDCASSGRNDVTELLAWCASHGL